MRDTKWKWEMVGGIIKHCENEKVVVQIARLFSKRGFNEKSFPQSLHLCDIVRVKVIFLHKNILSQDILDLI